MAKQKSDERQVLLRKPFKNVAELQNALAEMCAKAGTDPDKIVVTVYGGAFRLINTVTLVSYGDDNVHVELE